MKRTESLLITQIIFFLMVFLIGMLNADLHAQTAEQREQLLQFAERKRQEYQQQRVETQRIADSLGLPLRINYERGGGSVLMYFIDGSPVYYASHNVWGANTISTNHVWPGGAAGLELSGEGQTLGIWDTGRVLKNHVEFLRDDGTSRIVQVDDSVVAVLPDRHATHVAGTMIAKGVNPDAKGMAFEAQLDAHDFHNHFDEMSTAAAGGMQVSNHSYGMQIGWKNGSWYNNGVGPNRWHWFGSAVPIFDQSEDWRFGFYLPQTRTWDSIAYLAPNYLIVKSAGNDRGRGLGEDNHEEHFIWDIGTQTWTLSDIVREPDGGDDGYDSLEPYSVAKNILTVGAIRELPNGYSGPAGVVIATVANWWGSAWGPTDDGRIKPDIVAKGLHVLSCDATANNAYLTEGGTSMAAPMVSGSIALLNQHIDETHDGAIMRSATMKALVIHSADSANTNGGPDYKHGWGVMNTRSAAEIITNDSDNPGLHISEHQLNNRDTVDIRIWPTFDEPLKVTLAWTDVPGTPPDTTLNPTARMLVNDLDLRVIDMESGTEFEPWILDPANPSNPATRGDNFRDNVEQVQIPLDDLPQGPCPRYIVRITHKGDELRENGYQDFSLIITGNRSGIVYVKHDATGNNDGTSWDNAFNNFQNGIDASQPGEEVWVAAGTYFPTGNGSDRLRHFNLKNCVEFYGGFEGNEPPYFSKPGRDLHANETILDGEGDRYNVVRSANTIDSTAVIDGFTIQNGQADCDPWLDEDCEWLVHTAGGGIQNEGDPVIRNCTFRNNYGLTGGGAIANISSNPSIINCKIENNLAEECGGAIFNHFSSNPQIINSIIVNNQAITGGGICNIGGEATIINSTIADNLAFYAGGAIFTEWNTSATIDIKNSIIWGNETDYLPEIYAPCGHYCGNQIFNLETNTINLSYTNLQQTGDPGEVHIVNLGTINFGPGVISADPLFVNNYRLQANSPSVDTGNNDHVPEHIKVDIAWQQRIDSLAKVVDMGAYEWQHDCELEVVCPADIIICMDDPPVILNTTGVSPAGGTFRDAAGNIITEFDPAVYGSGIHTLTYTIVDLDTGCVGVCSITIKVGALVTCPADTVFCIDDPPVSLDALGAAPSGGDFSGPGLSGGYFDPAEAGIGDHVITYDYTDPLTECTHSCSFIISVHPMPVVECPNGFVVCIDHGEIVLTGGQPAGGNYSGPGVSGGIFNPATAGAGNHVITYEYIDSQTGCASICMFTIIVHPLPSVVCGPGIHVCLDEPPFEITGEFPAGGEYSGTGVDNGWFNPAVTGVGDHVITYEYTDQQTGCSNSCQFIISVHPVLVVDCPQNITVCINDGSFALTGGQPAGGNYSGPGVSGGNFNPAAAGAGDHVITYEYTDPQTGCTDSCVFTIIVLPLPNIVCGPDIHTCLDEPPFEITGDLPTGGHYSGTGVDNGWFNPAAAGVGNHVITYEYTDPQTGCTNNCQFTIFVHPLPVVNCPQNITVCLNDGSFVLTVGQPAGGNYSGPGVSGGNFNPAAAGVGNHIITYEYTNPATGCTNSCDFTITVRPLPIVNCPNDFSVCIDDSEVALTGRQPAGGNYSGAGVSGGNFNPATAGVGDHIITYEYTNPATGCTNSCDFTITVHPLPDVNCQENITVSIDDVMFVLTGATPAGGNFSGPGVSGGSFNPADAGVGNHIITYEYTDPQTNCTNVCTFNITVMLTDPPDIPDFDEVTGVFTANDGEICVDALQTIHISDAVFEPGAQVNLVAGVNILFTMGVHIQAGANVHGYIDQDGTFCGDLTTIVSNQYEELPADDAAYDTPVGYGDGDLNKVHYNFFRVYPNPTDGLFTLEIDAVDPVENISVYIYNLFGARVLQKEIPSEPQHLLDLTGYQNGVYIIRVIMGEHAQTERLIKN